jgi:DNA-directed RNA polymerase subunit RPC12/RpoP
MSLSRSLFSVSLSHPCPHCRHRHVAKGIWFRSIRGYSCSSCGGEIVLTYDDKVRLFASGQSAAIKDAPANRADAPQRWNPLTDPSSEDSDTQV